MSAEPTATHAGLMPVGLMAVPATVRLKACVAVSHGEEAWV